MVPANTDGGRVGSVGRDIHFAFLDRDVAVSEIDRFTVFCRAGCRLDLAVFHREAAFDRGDAVAADRRISACQIHIAVFNQDVLLRIHAVVVIRRLYAVGLERQILYREIALGNDAAAEPRSRCGGDRERCRTVRADERQRIVRRAAAIDARSLRNNDVVRQLLRDHIVAGKSDLQPFGLVIEHGGGRQDIAFRIAVQHDLRARAGVFIFVQGKDRRIVVLGGRVRPAFAAHVQTGHLRAADKDVVNARIHRFLGSGGAVGLFQIPADERAAFRLQQRNAPRSIDAARGKKRCVIADDRNGAVAADADRTIDIHAEERRVDRDKAVLDVQRLLHLHPVGAASAGINRNLAVFDVQRLLCKERAARRHGGVLDR